MNSAFLSSWQFRTPWSRPGSTWVIAITTPCTQPRAGQTDSLGKHRQRNGREWVGREEQTEIWNETEMEAEQTVGPSGIYDASGRTINANVANSASRSILGNLFIPFWREKKILPAYLSPHPLIFGNQPLIRGNLQMHWQNQKQLLLVL